MTKNVSNQGRARWKIITACAAAVWALSCVSALAEENIIVGLITKTNTNPFFAKMKEGAEAKAKELGSTFAVSPANMMATMRARWTRSSVL